MSAETKAALDGAVAAHIADVTEGNIVTDWALVAGSTSIDSIGTGLTGYFFEANDGQPVHVSFGLLSYALQSGVWAADDTEED